MRLIFDIESDGLLDTITKLHCICTIDADTGDIRSFTPDKIEEGLAYLMSADTLIGHNIIAYDIPAIKIVSPQFNIEGIEILDTLVLARLIKPHLKELHFADKYKAEGLFPRMYGSHSLKAWGMRLGCHKGDFGQTTDWSEYTPEMLSYCEQDVIVTLTLLQHLQLKSWSTESIKFEHYIAELCDRIGKTGWTFDTDKAAELYVKLAKERDELTAELSELFPPWTVGEEFIPKRDNKTKGYKAGEVFLKEKQINFNPNSRKHIEHCLKAKYNWKPKEHTVSGSAKIDETVLNILPYPEAKKLAYLFLLQKRLGQLAEGKNAWLKLERNGKLYHTINPMGTQTSRAASHSPNLQQVPSARGIYGKDCRELFKAPDGYSLVGSDLSGLELRVLASLLKDGGAYAREILEGDIHTANQKAMGLGTRDEAKTAIYCLIYGGGNGRLGEITGKGAEDGARIREGFVKANPAYGRLVSAAKAAVNSKGYLIGLDGRKIYCNSDFKALNYLIQCHGALICKKWLELIDRRLKAEQLDAKIVAWVHDEVQLIVRKGKEEYVGNNILQGSARKAGEAFKINIPIEAEYSVGQTWAETH